MTFPLRYSRLGYAKLMVTDLQEARRFYVDMLGLQLAHESDDQIALRCSDKPFDVIIARSPVAGLGAIGFELESEAELEKAFARLEERGYAPKWSGANLLAQTQAQAAFRVLQPGTGLEVDFYQGQQAADAPFVSTVTKIVRLGHVVLNVSNYEAAHKFWIEDLGLAISDHVPGRIAFLRCWPNALHHSVALIGGDEDGLNHVNFMVSDIDDIGRAMNRMKKADVPIVFGPGRHLPSTSIFLYFLDPEGMTMEYSFGMEELLEHDARDARELEAKPEVLDTWGSIADPRFGKIGRIVAQHD